MFGEKVQFDDIRKRRKYERSRVRPLVIDTNQFNRGLMMEILRTIGLNSAEGVRDEHLVLKRIEDHRTTVIFLEWSELNLIDASAMTRKIRSYHMEHVRRLPIIAMASHLTKEMVLEGRNAGIDEFLKRPCSPRDAEMRLKMVIETPRPFVDSKTYVGPCRRRKNPADYHGPRRRGHDAENSAKELTDAEQKLIDKDAPLSVELSRLKLACMLYVKGQSEAYDLVLPCIGRLHDVAKQEKDTAFLRALCAFETFILALATSSRHIQAAGSIVITGISTLEQLLVLPRQYESARETVSNAYSDAIERRLAA